MIKCIVGEAPGIVKSGTIAVTNKAEFGYNSQHRDKMLETNEIWQEICDNQLSIKIDSETTMTARQYCSQFSFGNADQHKKVGTLSGGERNRVMLAKSLRHGSNVLILDEPSLVDSNTAQNFCYALLLVSDPFDMVATFD